MILNFDEMEYNKQDMDPNLRHISDIFSLLKPYIVILALKLAKSDILAQKRLLEKKLNMGIKIAFFDADFESFDKTHPKKLYGKISCTH